MVASLAFSCHRYDDPRKAVDFANCVALLSVEAEGTKGNPTMEMVRGKTWPDTTYLCLSKRNLAATSKKLGLPS
jgi:hypothetical protein